MMEDILRKIAAADWAVITETMHKQGYAIIPKLLPDLESERLKENFASPEGYRKTVVMERYRFGLGVYKYFDYPLPDVVQCIRERIYSYLAPIANAWMKALNMETRFPDVLTELLAQCAAHDQLKPTALILKYGKGGHNTLHQDLYGEVYFPIQTVLFLSEPDEDYVGGEFVLTQQSPRMQSKAIVLKPKKGDLLIFTTNFRPEKGTKGYYRVHMKHGVSEVRSGERYALGIIFHDALT